MSVNTGSNLQQRLDLTSIFLGWMGPAPLFPRFLMVAMVVLWSLRLGIHLVRRVWRGPEDPRFVELRNRFGQKASLAFLGIFALQGLIGAIFVLPVLFVSWSSGPVQTGWEWVGIVVWLIGWYGESLADSQLSRFKRSASSAGQVCREGLWAYSRHPNYFFEFVLWVGIALYATGSTAGAWSWVCPLLMLILLVKGSGIPPTESQAIKTRGNRYRQYQEEVSAFVPWFPRRSRYS
ncbi:membrane protein containing DUF1295 [mine drainage metagenome]|uniref:Membrane protein containing DUF1295 n=1 Tax=mine drainage metagenome TaxID=410659 RepID=T0ZJS0_9ZZZZ